MPATAASAAAARSRGRAEPEQADAARADPAARVKPDRDGRARHREVARAPGELLDREALPPGRRREADPGEQLVGLKRGGPDAGEELRRRDLPLAAGREGLDGRVQGQGHRRVLGRRVRVGQRSADRAPVADLEVADQRRGAGQQGQAPGDQRRAADLRLGGARPDPDGVATLLDAAQRRDPADVDEVVEDREPHGEHRDQALPAGDHLRAVAELGEQVDGLLGAVRRVVLERGRLHWLPPVSGSRPCSIRLASIKPTMAAGVSGSRVIVTPNGASASATALTTAGGAPIAPPSPTPL